MSNLEPYSDYQTPTRALLSIKPQYSSAIFDGNKKFEFRRVLFSRPVDIIVVYSTAPVQRVVGEFKVKSIIRESLPFLWEQTSQFAGIDEDFFFQYFHDRACGYAIEIGEVQPYQYPFCPTERFGVRPPQSFVYLDVDNSFHDTKKASRRNLEKSSA